MSIIYPIETLDYGIVMQSMDPDYMNAFSTSRGGAYNVMSLAPTVWAADFTTFALKGNKYDEWRAWASSLRGGAGSFYLYDWRRKYPVNYPNGIATYGLTKAIGGAFTGICKINTVSTLDNHDITLDNLPNGYNMAKGDYMAFDYGAGSAFRALHRVVVGGIANSSGIVIVNVEPGVRPGWVAATNVSLEQAKCVMQVEQPFTQNVRWGKSKPSSDEAIISIKCKQVFRKA
jgi:hypothetical protein